MNNQEKELVAIVDHTNLSQTATWEDIKILCDEARTYGAASVCIPPCFVKKASNYVDGKVTICTVIGFPNGYSTSEVKVFETETAIRDGAFEIDMVININLVKDKNYEEISNEIKAIKIACKDKILKVIIETSLLTEEEKIEMCSVITKSGADFIKTSTGFSTDGATVADIELFKKHLNNHVKIKASGGIRTLEDAYNFKKLGAERLGTSKIVGFFTNSYTEKSSNY